ncbi:MAG: membrane protein insertase YidC, partial [Bdellovibrionales bacterium]|nr:membrane protein insertase YidC [Bdellovibrionales bacterium]
MSTPDKNSFMGPKNIIAIALAIGMLVGWQFYMQKKYGTTGGKSTVTQTAPGTEQPAPAGAVSGHAELAAPGKTATAGSPGTPIAPSEVPEKTVLFEDSNWKIEFVNRGMAFKSVELKKFKNRAGTPVVLGRANAPYLFQTVPLGDFELQPLNFEIERKSENEFVGTAVLGETRIVKTLTLRPSDYAVDLKLNLVGSDPRVKGLRHFLVEDIIPTEGASLLNPALDFQTTYVTHGDGSESRQLNQEQFKTVLNFKSAHAAAVGQHYFASGIVDGQNRIVPEFFGRLDDAGKSFIGHWDYLRNSGDQNLDVSMKLYAGPKSVDLLKAVDEKLVGIVDYGWFGWLARPMLWLMNL